MTTTTVSLGDEYDEPLIAATREALELLGALRGDADWALVGSQELVCERYVINGRELRLEAETYIGLTLTGDADLVAKIRAAVEAREEGRG